MDTDTDTDMAIDMVIDREMNMNGSNLVTDQGLSDGTGEGHLNKHHLQVNKINLGEGMR